MVCRQLAQTQAKLNRLPINDFLPPTVATNRFGGFCEGVSRETADLSYKPLFRCRVVKVVESNLNNLYHERT